MRALNSLLSQYADVQEVCLERVKVAVEVNQLREAYLSQGVSQSGEGRGGHYFCFASASVDNG